MAKYGSFKYGMAKYGQIMLQIASAIFDIIVQITKEAEAFAVPRATHKYRITTSNNETVHISSVSLHLPIQWEIQEIDAPLDGTVSGDIKLYNGNIVPKEEA